MVALPLLLSLLISSLRVTTAFSFNFTSPPNQCNNVSLSWTEGTPPYSILMVPIGALDGPEIRTIVDVNVTSGTTYTQMLSFPAKSQFVAVMSDATGVGTGGTSAVITVGDGPTSCLSTTPTTPKFYFYLDPGSPSQCGTIDLSWQPSKVDNPVSIWGIIPGGQSFAISSASANQKVDWTANVRSGTQMLFVVGDETGHGKGGSSDLMSVGSGSSGCINAASPSSTMGTPAGQIQTAVAGGGGSGGNAPTTAAGGGNPTGTQGSTSPTNGSGNGNGNGNGGNGNGGNGGNGGGGTNTQPGSGGGTVVGPPIATGSGGSGQLPSQRHSHMSLAALIGGIVGGVFVLVVAARLLVCFRRKRQDRHRYERRENLLADEPVRSRPGTWYAAETLPQWYRPEPFTFPVTSLSSGQASHGHADAAGNMVYSDSCENPYDNTNSNSHGHSGELGRRESYTTSSNHHDGQHRRNASSMSDHHFMVPTSVIYTPEPFSDQFASARPLSVSPYSFPSNSSYPSNNSRSPMPGPSTSQVISNESGGEKSPMLLEPPPMRQPLIRGMSHISGLSQDAPDTDGEGDPENLVDLPPLYHSIRRKSRDPTSS